MIGHHQVGRKPGNKLDKAPPMLSAGLFLRERWTIEAKIGSGGFGQIVRAADARLGESVAVKVGDRRRDKDTARMVLETMVFMEANVKQLKHIPRLYGSGQEPVDRPRVNFIVMQLLGGSLTDHRRQSPLNRLTRATALRCAFQAVEGLRELHGLGYVHRDIKPGNLVFGNDPINRRTLFVIDFGLVRKYTDRNGALRPARPGRVGFRGTTRYASIRVLNRWEQCRADDMIAVFYTLIELINGLLPWRHFRDQADVCECKKSYLQPDKYDELCAFLPESVRQWDKMLRALEFEDEPEYSVYLQLLDQAITDLGSSHEHKLDWEDWQLVLDEPRDLKHTLSKRE